MIFNLRRSSALLSTLGFIACASPAPRAPVQAAQPRAEILWDSYGVPHIFAADRNAAAYALGWAHMRNHADLVLRLYAQGRGSAAELLGERYLPEDRWVWLMGIPSRAEQWLTAQSPEMRAHITAYVSGINAFARAHPELVGDSVRAVLPARESDPLAHLQRLSLSGLVTSRGQVEAETRGWREQGSNAWAIAPSRSASGYAMLLANPHLPWGDLYTWVEAQLVLPDVNLYGAGFAGLPLLQIAFNDRLGWTHTVNTQDVADHYELTIASGGYEWDGGVREFDVERRVLRVRAGEGPLRDDTLIIRRSVHGPVVAEKAGGAVALRVVGLDLPGAFDQWWRMGTARTFAEFDAAIRPNQITSQTITYADADGHVMMFYGGNTPVRPVNDQGYWAGIVPGNTAATLWTELHGFDEMPRVVDPPGGWVQNANEPPWWATFPPTLSRANYPAYFATTSMSLRAQRSVAMLGADSSITLDALIAHKHSTEVEAASRLLADLVPAGRQSSPERVRRAAAVLENWDRRTDAESAGAVLFFAWAGEYQRRMGRSSIWARAWSEAAPRSTPSGIADPAVALAALDSAAELVVAKYGTLDVPWGDVYRLRWGGLDLPANGAWDPYGVFRAVRYTPAREDRYVAFAGDTYVAVVEFGPVIRARSLLTYGNSSRAGSPHATDQLPLFASQALKPVWRTREEIAQHLTMREAILPP